jgi:arsenite-transporting ATPase
VPVLTARLFDDEMVGAELLADLAEEVYEDRDAGDVLHTDEPMRLRKRGDKYVLSLRLPFAEGRLGLSRRGEELILTVGAYRRNILLPSSLRRREVEDAAFDGPLLKITFGSQDG